MSEKVTCRYCKKTVRKGKSHHCRAMRRDNVTSQTADEGDFFVSMAVAAATDDWALGAMVGGSLSGGIVGDMFSDSDSGSSYSGSDSSGSDFGGDDD